MYVAGNATKCLLTRGVRLLEVSVSGGLTVLIYVLVMSNMAINAKVNEPLFDRFGHCSLHKQFLL